MRTPPVAGTNRTGARFSKTAIRSFLVPIPLLRSPTYGSPKSGMIPLLLPPLTAHLFLSSYSNFLFFPPPPKMFSNSNRIWRLLKSKSNKLNSNFKIQNLKSKIHFVMRRGDISEVLLDRLLFKQALPAQALPKLPIHPAVPAVNARRRVSRRAVNIEGTAKCCCSKKNSANTKQQ